MGQYTPLSDRIEMAAFIRRIRTDSVRDVKLLDLLNAVWKFIYTKKGETFIEMKKRLKEEIEEAIERLHVRRVRAPRLRDPGLL